MKAKLVKIINSESKMNENNNNETNDTNPEITKRLKYNGHLTKRIFVGSNAFDQCRIKHHDVKCFKRICIDVHVIQSIQKCRSTGNFGELKH